MTDFTFEWDDAKSLVNLEKHGIDFALAQQAFADTRRIIIKDPQHSETEERFFCLGCVEDGIITVRFTMRDKNVRIFGAGYWRKGRKFYEETYTIHG
jgi:uncharacterized DUF497 family protein